MSLTDPLQMRLHPGPCNGDSDKSEGACSWGAPHKAWLPAATAAQRVIQVQTPFLRTQTCEFGPAQFISCVDQPVPLPHGDDAVTRISLAAGC